MKQKIIFQNKENISSNNDQMLIFLADVNVYHFLLSSDGSKNLPSASQMPVHRVGEGWEELKGVPHNLQSPRSSSAKLPSSYHLACRRAVILARK